MEVPELKYVDFELKDGIGMITMNNPEKLNALTMEGAQSLTKILNACSDSPEVRVIVIRGAQGNFCGGGDVKGMKYKVDNNCCETRPGLRCNNDVILSIVNNAKPVIAWLEGAVAGGGVFGDHCSPLSDTTVLSSTGSASDHIDHVQTQLPYALCCGTLAVILYLVIGFAFV